MLATIFASDSKDNCKDLIRNTPTNSSRSSGDNYNFSPQVSPLQDLISGRISVKTLTKSISQLQVDINSKCKSRIGVCCFLVHMTKNMFRNLCIAIVYEKFLTLLHKKLSNIYQTYN